MFLFKRKKIDIPDDLRLELRELQERRKLQEKQPIIRYSVSMSEEKLNEAKKSIKKIKLSPPFKEVLFEFIDKKNLTDPEVYKKAKVDRRTFSKIRTGDIKYVSRNTAIRLGLALNLNQKDFDKLLESNLSHLGTNEYFGIAIRWCIKNKIYDIDQVNDILYACDVDLLKKY